MLQRNLTNTAYSNALIAVLMLSQSVLLARILHPEQRGIFGVLNYSVEFLSTVFFLNLFKSANFWGSKNEPKHILFAFLYRYVFISFLFVLFLLLIGFIFFNNRFFIFPYGVFGETFFIYIVVILFLRSIYHCYAEYLRGRGFNIYVNKCFLGLAVSLNFFYGIFLLVKSTLYTTNYLYVIGINILLSAGFTFSLWRKYKTVQVSNETTNSSSLYLKYAQHGYFDKLFSYSQNRADYFMLLYLNTSPELMGIYLIVIGIFNVYQQSITELCNVLFSHFARIDSTTLEDAFHLFLKFLAIGLFFVVLFIYFFSYKIIYLLYGTQYLYSVSVLVLMLPALFFFGLNQLFMAYFSSKNLQKINIIINGLVLLISIGLYFFYIHKLGMPGAAWAYSIAQFIAFILFAIAYWYINGKSAFFRFFDLRELKFSHIRQYFNTFTNE